MANNRLYICEPEKRIYCMISKIYYNIDASEYVWNAEKLYYFMKHYKNKTLITGYESDHDFYNEYITKGSDFTCIELERKQKLKKLNEL